MYAVSIDAISMYQVSIDGNGKSLLLKIIKMPKNKPMTEHSDTWDNKQYL